jgi:murein DD-endopeptidase MepM/ murein hydrolase activator NlpD
MKNKITTIVVVLFALTFLSTVNAQSTDQLALYVIQPNDSLGSIAIRFGISLSSLIEINGISNPDLISPGQTLKIPGLTGIDGIITPVTINFGESAAEISIKYQIDQDQLISLNKLTTLFEIYAGSNVLIPINTTKLQPIPAALINNNSSPLEIAALINSNPFDLLLLNKKSSSIRFIPGDVLFKLPVDNEKPISRFSKFVDELIFTPLPLKQGATASIHIKTNTPMSLQGTINGMALHFFTNDGENYFALQGIHAMATPGLKTFDISGNIDTVTNFSYEQNVLFISGNFETDPSLIVDPETIDPMITKPEEEAIFSLTSIITPEKHWSGIFKSPAFYQEYNSYFGNRRTYNDNPEVTFHTGVDFAGGVGLPITAPAAGKVVFAGPLTVRGNATFIDHGWGVYSGFFHQSKIDVKVGVVVTINQKIGEVGNSGRVNGADDFPGAGAHLHWELWVNGVQVNPLIWLNQEFP